MDRNVHGALDGTLVISLDESGRDPTSLGEHRFDHGPCDEIVCMLEPASRRFLSGRLRYMTGHPVAVNRTQSDVRPARPLSLLKVTHRDGTDPISGRDFRLTGAAGFAPHRILL